MKTVQLLMISLFFCCYSNAQTLQQVTDAGNTTSNRIIMSPIYTPGSRITAYGYGSGYLDIYNNSNNSISMDLMRSDGAMVFNIDGHTMNAYFGGNVGIGTQTPGHKLDVNGTVSASSLTTHGSSFSGINTPTNISSLSGLQINGDIPNVSHNGITYQSGGGGGAAIGFYRGGSYDTGIDFYTNSVNVYGNLIHRMRINSNGNVGIGTVNPMQNFVVSHAGSLGFEIYDDYTNNTFGLQVYNRSTSNYGRMQLDASQFALMQGNVGIGTITPREKLSVNGKIRAQEIKVETTNWPDYVFSNTYQPSSLSDLETYIKTNKHLPEIPSAREVEENGLSLGEMNAKLLKKIEELTLHVIELSKRLDEKDLETKVLQNEIEQLKKK